jgi:hypothetical protein
VEPQANKSGNNLLGKEYGPLKNPIRLFPHFLRLLLRQLRTFHAGQGTMLIVLVAIPWKVKEPEGLVRKTMPA